MRALERLGLADVYGRSKIPLYVMNVAYPVVPSEVTRFCAGKRAVLLVEEGQPNFIEQNLATILRQADLQTALHGKDLLAAAGEYTGAEVLKGMRAFLERYGRSSRSPRGAGDRRAQIRVAADAPQRPAAARRRRARPAARLLHRLPRAADLQRDEAGRARARRASRQRRHRLPPVLDPAAVPHRQHDDGLRPRHGRRVGVHRRRARREPKRAIS